MHSLILALFLVMFVPNVACADEASARKAAEIKLFELGLRECVKKVYYVGNGYFPGEDKGLIEACLLEKGVSLTSRTVDGAATNSKTRRMGGKGLGYEPSTLNYEIGDLNAFAENLKNGGRTKEAPEREVNQLPDNSPSIHNKYYLPSDKSDEGPKPIFLNRKKK